MADRYINGVLHRAEKVHRGTCTKCGKSTGCAWRVSKILAGVPRNKTEATFCYECTGNHWAKSLSLYQQLEAS